MNLKFDKMTVDTTLAQAFLENEKKNISLFVDQKYTFDGDKFYNDDDDVDESPPILNKCSPIKLRQLAALVKENTELFAQLEYLTRNIPIEDTKVQISLIIKQFYYVASYTEANNSEKYWSEFIMKNDRPFLHWGILARLFLLNTACPIIYADTETVAVCYLIAKLCYKAGLGITIIKTTRDDLSEVKIDPGAIGVISENSDVDSAVDVFLMSSQQAPWSLRWLLVQETAYQQFLEALTWKCNLNKQFKTETSYTLTSDVLEYNGRRFLIDSMAVSDPKPNQVRVEVYRTRKELLTLLSDRERFYLSLWANDIAEINELTHNICSPVTWVNSFGDFRGPPQISEAIYSFYSPSPFNKFIIAKSEQVNELYKLQRSWRTRTIEERRVILCNALSKFLAAKPVDQVNEKLYTDIKDIIIQLEFSKCSGFVNVEKDYVCVGIPTHWSTSFVWDFDFASVKFFESILYGNAFALNSTCCPALSDVLKNAGIPVIDIKKEPIVDKKTVYLNVFPEKAPLALVQPTRAIWTNSGTIFAN